MRPFAVFRPAKFFSLFRAEFPSCLRINTVSKAKAHPARNAALLASFRYQSGLVDFQTVLDTERSVRTLEDSQASTQADNVMAMIQLYKALGGGWSADAATASSSTP